MPAAAPPRARAAKATPARPADRPSPPSSTTRWARRNGWPPRALGRKADKLLADGRAQDAIAELGPALVLLLGEESIRARVVLARAYTTMPKLRGRAEGVLTEAIRDSPRIPSSTSTSAACTRSAGNREAATRVLPQGAGARARTRRDQTELDAVLGDSGGAEGGPYQALGDDGRTEFRT